MKLKEQKTTMIRVSEETKRLLKELAKYGDSMDSVIRRLLSKKEKTK